MCRNTADSLLHMCESHATHTHEKHSEITSNDYKGWVRKCTHALMYTCMLKSMKSVCLPKKKKKGHFIIKLRPFQVRVGIRARRNGSGVPLPSTGIHQLKYSQWGSLELAHKSVLRTRDSL